MAVSYHDTVRRSARRRRFAGRGPFARPRMVRAARSRPARGRLLALAADRRARRVALPLAHGAARDSRPAQLVRASPGSDSRRRRRRATSLLERSRATCPRAPRASTLAKLPDEDGIATRSSQRAFRPCRLARCLREACDVNQRNPHVGGRGFAEIPRRPPRRAADDAQAQGEEGRASRLPRSLRPRELGRITKRSTPPAGSPRKAIPRCCGAFAEAEGAAGRLRLASRATRARRSPRNSGPSRTALPTFTSSRHVEAPSRTVARHHADRGAVRAGDRPRRASGGRLRHRRRCLQARLDGAGPPALAARPACWRRRSAEPGQIARGR